MASEYHKTIPIVLREIIKDYKSLSSKGYLSVEEENVIKIYDPTPKSRSMIEYEPDFIIKRNISPSTYFLIVFEVLSNQDDIKAMADIARILSTRKIKRAIFLSTNGTKKEETDRIVKTLKGSYKKRFNKTEKDDVIDILSLEIFTLKTKKKIKEHIKKEMNERGSSDEILALAIQAMAVDLEEKFKKSPYDDKTKEILEEIQENKKSSPETIDD